MDIEKGQDLEQKLWVAVVVLPREAYRNRHLLFVGANFHAFTVAPDSATALQYFMRAIKRADCDLEHEPSDTRMRQVSIQRLGPESRSAWIEVLLEIGFGLVLPDGTIMTDGDVIGQVLDMLSVSVG